MSKSPQRKRTEKEAIACFDRMAHLPPAARRRAITEIRASKRPMLSAKRLAQARIDIPTGKGRLDHSDVQEIICKLLRRDGLIDTPQASMIRRLDVLVAAGGTRREFDRIAKIVLGMPQAMPKKELKEEVEYSIQKLADRSYTGGLAFGFQGETAKLLHRRRRMLARQIADTAITFGRQKVRTPSRR